MALIVDTGPLYASLDRELLEGTLEAILLPSPVLVETFYLLERRLDATAAQALLRALAAGEVQVEELVRQDYERVAEICTQYADLRVGFVDAAVLAVVERLGEPKLATLDRRHFSVMRPRHVQALTLLPG